MSTTNPDADGAPLSKTQSYSASKSAMAAIFGPGHRYNNKENGDSSEQKPTESKVEPPSGIKGAGTLNEPYDQGNAPENVGQVASGKAGQEPLSGAKGKGTVDEPYDRGNEGGK
jgi:hypothetical protein